MLSLQYNKQSNNQTDMVLREAHQRLSLNNEFMKNYANVISVLLIQKRNSGLARIQEVMPEQSQTNSIYLTLLREVFDTVPGLERAPYTTTSERYWEMGMSQTQMEPISRIVNFDGSWYETPWGQQNATRQLIAIMEGIENTKNARTLQVLMSTPGTYLKERVCKDANEVFQAITQANLEWGCAQKPGSIFDSLVLKAQGQINNFQDNYDFPVNKKMVFMTDQAYRAISNNNIKRSSGSDQITQVVRYENTLPLGNTIEFVQVNDVYRTGEENNKTGSTRSIFRTANTLVGTFESYNPMEIIPHTTPENFSKHTACLEVFEEHNQERAPIGIEVLVDMSGRFDPGTGEIGGRLMENFRNKVLERSNGNASDPFFFRTNGGWKITKTFGKLNFLKKDYFNAFALYFKKNVLENVVGSQGINSFNVFMVEASNEVLQKVKGNNSKFGTVEVELGKGDSSELVTDVEEVDRSKNGDNQNYWGLVKNAYRGIDLIGRLFDEILDILFPGKSINFKDFMKLVIFQITVRYSSVIMEDDEDILRVGEQKKKIKIGEREVEVEGLKKYMDYLVDPQFIGYLKMTTNMSWFDRLLVVALLCTVINRDVVCGLENAGVPTCFKWDFVRCYQSYVGQSILVAGTQGTVGFTAVGFDSTVPGTSLKSHTIGTSIVKHAVPVIKHKECFVCIPDVCIEKCEWGLGIQINDPFQHFNIRGEDVKPAHVFMGGYRGDFTTPHSSVSGALNISPSHYPVGKLECKNSYTDFYNSIFEFDKNIKFSQPILGSESRENAVFSDLITKANYVSRGVYVKGGVTPFSYSLESGGGLNTGHNLRFNATISSHTYGENIQVGVKGN